VNWVDLWGLFPKNGQIYEIQIHVEMSLEILRGTEWGKTEGKEIIDELQRMNDAGLIEHDSKTTYAAYYDRNTGKIGISTSLARNQYEGTLAHEGKHRMDHILGLPYTIESEYRAFDVLNRVNAELGYGRPFVTRDEINELYKNIFPADPQYQKNSQERCGS
jgi:hypothetical protein